MMTLQQLPDYSNDIVQTEITRMPTILGHGRMAYNGTIIPRGLTSKLISRSKAKGLSQEQMEEKVRAAIHDKEFILHGKKHGEKLSYFALTSEEFSPIFPKDMAAALQQYAQVEPKVRTYGDDMSIDFHLPMDSELDGVFARVGLGQYGQFGGNGESAVKYGISWYNGACTNWTLFQPEGLPGFDRVIHRKKDGNFSIDELADRMEAIGTFHQTVLESIESSKSKGMSRDELQAYFDMYQKDGINKGIAQAVMKTSPLHFNLYNVSWHLTKAVQNPNLCKSTTTRKKVEYLAGELLLSYDRIVEKIHAHRT